MKTEAEKGITVIALITAICMLGDAMLYIVLPVYWKDFGLTSIWQVGVLLSVNRFVRLPLTPFVGWLYHRISKRTGVLIAVSLAVLTTFSYGVLNGFWVLLIMRCLWGVAWAFLRLGGYLTVLDASDEHNRGFLIGKYNGLCGLGGLAGMLAGGILADLIGIEVVTLVFAAAALISILFVFRYVPSNVGYNEKTTKEKEAFRQIWKKKNVIAVMITGMLIAAVFFGIFMSTLSRMIEVFYSDSLSLFGIAFGAATLAGIIQAIRWGLDPFLAPRFGRLSDGKSGRTPFLITALFLGGGLFIILSLDLPLLVWIVVLLCLQLTSTMIITVTDSLTTDVASSSNKVAVMTMYTVVVDVGAAIGPVLGYLLSEFFNISVLYWITGGLLLSMGAFWLIKGGHTGYTQRILNDMQRRLQKERAKL
ncbi:MFS transporter [Pseudalkalibacillus decolorationis]|uniref:MFS transporter n=1 Tax=Pseudalkalibacillus decolorationis TaxID=163879 RepID=UPI002148CE3E|nr:MFS transporter [Pseudalkalibacillus decolorationis]